MKTSLVAASAFAIGFLLGSGPTIASFVSTMLEKPSKTPGPFENAVLTRVPFDGNWFVSWGGENKEDNHHYGFSPQDLALDIRRIVDGSDQAMKGDPKKNESYGCWAQPILSPVDGVVEVAVDGVPDNIPGEVNRYAILGNYVMVKSRDGFVAVLCHFKMGSLVKKVGQQVKSGELLGLCGNSGRSTEPHLHFHVQSEVSIDKSVALRAVFPEITVGGVSKAHYSPKRSDIISKGK